MDTTSASLIDRLRQPAGQAAWARFVELYTPLLYRWAGRFRLSADDSADLVQEVLTLLVQKLPAFTYDPQQSFRGWLWTLTLNHWRAGQRRKALPLSVNRDQLDELPMPEGTQRLDEAEYRGYVVGRILQLMRSEFQEHVWRAFWENVAEDRPATDVADALGLSVVAVYTAKSRVLRRLRQELQFLLD